MRGKVRVIKRGSLNSMKVEEAPKASSKENFRNLVADWQTCSKESNLPSFKDLFPSQGSFGKLNTTP